MTVPPIAAIATPPGRGGIGIVRVSGRDITALIAGVAGRDLPPRMATRVVFRDARGGTIDDGIALHFPAPHSYTGEDVVEWHGHGGVAVMRLLLARCVELGARLAEPGEFTKRAFLNGKLDLAQAESVADVIEASTATAVRAAARSLTGEFSREVNALRDALVELRMYAEATLDFPDEDIELLREGDVAARLAAIRERLLRLLVRSRAGALLRSGMTAVLVGAPNVGKSSLLNRLVGEDAAIVTPIPGTTRDTIERQIEVGGVPLTVIDTAGLRDSDDEVERHGIARARAAIARADVALVVVDARDDAHGKPPGIAPELPAALDGAHLPDNGRDVTHVWLCALTGEGVSLLEGEMLRIAGASEGLEDAFFARARHLEALDAAGGRLEQASEQLKHGNATLELFAEDLRAAQSAFSAITGAFTADDLLGEIFSRFCIGK